MNSIRNFVQLTENFGTAGQPTADQFQIVADNGYEHVINIGMPDHSDALANEGSLVTSLGMSYLHIPVPFLKPKPKHVKLFCDMLWPIRHQKVFVHCIMNYRVSAFMYHYLSKVEQRKESDCKSIMLQRWNIEPVWQDVLSWSSADISL